MITVESTSKLNQLADVLRHHGFAEDSFEAIEQANKLMRKGPSASSTSGPIAQQTSYDEAMAAMEQRLSTFERSKHLMHTRIDQLSAQLASILKRLEHLDSAPRRPAPSTPAEPGPRAPAPQQSLQPASPPASETGASPRTGSFSSNDVSIMKYFYCGTR